MSTFYIYDYSSKRTLLGILQDIKSVQWLENYQSPGEVKIEARVTDINKYLLVVGNRIYNDDYTSSAKICTVEYSGEGAESCFIVRAVITSRLLDQRVVMATLNLTNAEKGMYAAYTKNRRSLPIGVASVKGLSQKVDTEITWGSVLEAEETIAEMSGLGFRVNFNPETHTETFEVYSGVDRTAGANYIGYFGTDIGNLSKFSIIRGNEDWKNVAVVAGEGEGADRKVYQYSISKSISGEARRELFVDARDIQSTYQVATDTGEVDEDGNPIMNYETKTYTAAEYTNLLKARGIEKLAECLKTLELSAVVSQDNVSLGKDYGLGDKLPIKIEELGLMLGARVASVNTVYEQSGKTVNITLDDFEYI